MDFPELCAATGLPPSRIRYFEGEFRDLFDPSAGFAGRDRYEPEHVNLLQFINRLMVGSGKSAAEVRIELQRIATERQRPPPRTIVVTSGKGGVGKTTVSLNLAIALAAGGARTLLIDADMGLGNVHVLAGIQPSGTVLDVVERRATLAEILADGPSGIRVLCGASGIAELADIDARRLDDLLDQINRAAAEFDVVVIDTAAGIAAQVTRFLRLADEIVLVTTPNIAATLDAYGVVKVVHEARLPARLHVLVNLAESNKQAVAVHARLHDCAQRFLNRPLAHLGQLQKHGAVERANQQRQPFLLEAPESLNARRLVDMAAALLALPPPARATADTSALPLDLLLRSFAGANRRQAP